MLPQGEMRAMDIWLVNPYGPIPGEGWREYRYTMIGEALASRGHRVIWWTANFSHHFKRFRSAGWTDIPVTENFTIRLVPTREYEKNISLGRIRFELLYAARMHRAACRLTPPNLIIAVNPPQSATFTAALLAHRFGAYLVVDVFDLWPELFVLALPRRLRGISNIIFSPLYSLRRYSLRRAHAVMAVCGDYLAAAKCAAKMQEFPPADVFFIGVDVGKMRAQRMPVEIREEFALRVGKKDGEIWAIYPGTLGNNYDIMTLLETSVHLASRGIPASIIIAGEGPLRSAVEDFIGRNSGANLKYIGKLTPEELQRYYEVCDIGLSPYLGESTVAMPTKVYDFLAAGLPVINSLPGELERLIATKEFGVQYTAGDSESLFNAIASLAHDPIRLKTLGRNSFAAATVFDKTAQYSRMVKFVEQVATQRRSFLESREEL